VGLSQVGHFDDALIAAAAAEAHDVADAAVETEVVEAGEIEVAGLDGRIRLVGDVRRPAPPQFVPVAFNGEGLPLASNVIVLVGRPVEAHAGVDWDATTSAEVNGQGVSVPGNIG